MATRTHNEFLDADQNDDDQSQGYDSEVEDLRKGGRSAKRRKVDSEDSDDSDDSDGSEDEEEEEDITTSNKDLVEDRKAQEDTPTSLEKPEKKVPRLRKGNELPNISKPLTKKNLVATEKAIKKSGVVYLSRIPPFMKPAKLRSLLEPYGAINRIFLTPEDPTSHTKRVRNGGNKKRSFADGWVEFINKAEAKQVCELLNAKTIGGKKGSYYHDDVWNLIYLKGFKWNNLTEQITAENAERSSRMRAEISQTTKESKEFVLNVERAKMLEGMEAKKAAKKRKEDDEATEEPKVDFVVKESRKGGERPRKFKQTSVAVKSTNEKQPEQVKRVLSRIF